MSNSNYFFLNFLSKEDCNYVNSDDYFQPPVTNIILKVRSQGTILLFLDESHFQHLTREYNVVVFGEVI